MAEIDPDDSFLFAERLLALLVYGDGQVAHEISSSLPAPILARSNVLSFLSSGDSVRRLMGLARAVIEHAYAGNPLMALRIRDALYSLGLSDLADAAGASSELKSKFLGSVRSAAARAALQIGDFDRALALVEGGDDHPFQNERLDSDIWLENVKYEILIRRLQIPEAVAFRESRSSNPQSPSDNRAELDDMLKDYAPLGSEDELLKPAKPFSWDEQIVRMLNDWIIRQTHDDTALEESYASTILTADDQQQTASKFEQMRAARVTIKRAIDGYPTDRHRDDVIQLELQRHMAAARDLLSPPMDRPRTLIDNNRDLNRAAQIVGMRAPLEDELQTALSLSMASAAWSHQAGDLHGEMLSIWTAGQAAEWLKMKSAALGHYEALLNTLRQLRPRLPSALGRAILSRSFRTLIPRIVALAVESARHGLAFEALEFRRGLALAEGTSERAGVELPIGVHYLTVSDFAERGAYVAVRASGGTVVVARLDIGILRACALAAYIDPGSWLNPLTKKDRSPREALSQLLALLQSFFDRGDIRYGDHIVAALDHPYHMVPIHYLDFGGDLAVCTFSFSRIASFQELLGVISRPPCRPGRTAAVLVHPVDAASRAMHDAAFTRSIGSLRDVVVLEGEDADVPHILELLGSSDLVHFHTHGIFPEAYPDQVVDPVEGAGLLIASNGHLPSRAHPRNSLLRLRHILKAPPVATDISLSACVSGLGRPGRGEDMLGLEFAFRRRGARTVVASHWHVDVGIAGEFFAEYYTNWLDRGLPRGQAWRQSILANIVDQTAPSESCARCAFSIYGDWR